MSVRALSGASPRLVTWGSGSFGAVGDGTYQTRAVPAVVELPDPVTHAHASRTPQAAAAVFTSCAVATCALSRCPLVYTLSAYWPAYAAYLFSLLLSHAHLSCSPSCECRVGGLRRRREQDERAMVG